jgi:exodeoxyribonuclease V gamma subunit
VGVHVHRSQRTNALLQGLASLLTDIPSDPFTPEIVAVPTPGIERFITQGLGTILGTSGDSQDGVCANVVFPSPAAVVNRLISQATGNDPHTDPWLSERAVWPLLSVIDRSAGEAWCEPLARHLGLDVDDPHRRDRRFAVATRLVSLFGTYASQRPQMLLDWADGRDTDGAGAGIRDDLSWQPVVWRALRDEIGIPSLAERMADACAAVRSDRQIVDLPERLSVFGASRLPADQLQILSALGDKREVHLWLADASPVLWRELSPGESTRRREDTSAAHVANPLLRSLGRDARELRIRLAQHALETDDQHLLKDLAADTLLGHLQRQLRGNADPRTQGMQRPGDGSIQVHACHGQTRQAEVIREIILRLLQDDPTLEPRDILMMCPDLDAFAPLLSAAFGGPGGSGTRRLRIADCTPEQSNAVLTALAVLVELITGRLELSVLLDFAAQPPVSTRF